jgi:hypothetical protein
MGRNEQFSYSGLIALFKYLKELEEGTGEEMEQAKTREMLRKTHIFPHSKKKHNQKGKGKNGQRHTEACELQDGTRQEREQDCSLLQPGRRVRDPDERQPAPDAPGRGNG